MLGCKENGPLILIYSIICFNSEMFKNRNFVDGKRVMDEDKF